MMKSILKVIGCLVAACIVLMFGAVFLLNTDAFQNKLLRHATQLLSEKLHTRVEIDSVSIGLFSQNVNLYGLDVEDLQQEDDRHSIKLAVLGKPNTGKSTLTNLLTGPFLAFYQIEIGFSRFFRRIRQFVSFVRNHLPKNV